MSHQARDIARSTQHFYPDHATSSTGEPQDRFTTPHDSIQYHQEVEETDYSLHQLEPPKLGCPTQQWDQHVGEGSPRPIAYASLEGDLHASLRVSQSMQSARTSSIEPVSDTAQLDILDQNCSPLQRQAAMMWPNEQAIGHTVAGITYPFCWESNCGSAAC